MMAIEPGDTPFSKIAEELRGSFHQVAVDKGLEFTINVAADLPKVINTDHQRLQQILKNLLSNAFKFTDKGRVSLEIKVAKRRGGYANEALNQADQVIAFQVSDTGIGIPAEKQRIIFEAFQQADGTTSRKYGGTGLGLSISREIARRLGGEIRVVSEPGKGSVFTLYLPSVYKTERQRDREAEGRREAFFLPSLRPSVSPSPVEIGDYGERVEVADDRNDIEASDRVALIVDDDALFAQSLLEIAHERGFKGVVASQGGAALRLARRYKPDAITLDIQLPDHDGWTALDRLKHDPKTRHIPVYVITADDSEDKPQRLGAFAFLRKPATREQLVSALDQIAEFVERKVRRLLVVEGDDARRESLVEMISEDDVDTTAVASGEEALAELRKQRFDCMALGLKLADVSGFDLIERIQREPEPPDLPVVVYIDKDLTEEEEARLRTVSVATAVKEARSPEGLVAETSLFLHRDMTCLPERRRDSLRHDPALKGRKALIVDDDVRNVFALTSALEDYGIEVLHAENGREGIETLNENPDVDVVLMDIMMPEMDGYETTRAVRLIERFKTLPIIALTAKAMKDDRDKCIKAGASDYIAKPIDIDQLLSILRIWLYRPKAAGA
jgi:CheY-like chemotaxis protein